MVSYVAYFNINHMSNLVKHNNETKISCMKTTANVQIRNS